MPSSTLLPTPDPANRPRRCPRPTVSSALMARTPVSSGSRTGSRSMALIWLRPMGSAATSRRGPAWSRGLPCASTPRPSSPSPSGTRKAPTRLTGRTGSPRRGTGTYGAAGTTAAPLDRPWMSPAGIRKALSPEKPTTSASTGALPGICTRHCEPTGTRMPTASSTRPVRRVSVPRASRSGPSATRARAPRRYSCQGDGARGSVVAFVTAVLPGLRQAQRGNGALPALVQTAVNDHARLLHQAATRRHRRIGHPLHALRSGLLLQGRFEQGMVLRVQAHGGCAAVHRKHGQCFAHHRQQCLGIRLQLPAHDLARNFAGELQHFLRGRLLQLVEPHLEAPHNGLDPLGSLCALLGNVIVQALLPLQAGLGMALRLPLGKGIGARLLQGLLVLRFDERRIGPDRHTAFEIRG